MDAQSPTRFDAAKRRLTIRRRGQAVAAARQATAALADRGVRVLVFGSLARGDFALHSDVDLPVVGCPEGMHYRIEGLVEDCMAGLPFDVCYLDELPPDRAIESLAEAKDAADLPEA